MIPIIPNHKCTNNIAINGHQIPKNTLTQPFFLGPNMDEKYFKGLLVFNPNRFHANEGKFNFDHEHISSGKGKRICAGKSLADAELFLFFIDLLQRYKFTHPNGPVDLSCNLPSLLLPKLYICKTKRR
uniref:Cytochrome P450 18a1 (inferred by orthology to a D. melanogaster protein) n=1 Tax=Strongyloides venezuelensis TaxID=75913 RepID=A0A0K0EZ40_STRVS